MEQNINSRRRKILSISYPEILRIVQLSSLSLPNSVSVPKFTLPEGVEIISVHENYAAMAFDFVIQHHSFSEVSEGCMMEHIKCDWETVYIDIKNAAEVPVVCDGEA